MYVQYSFGMSVVSPRRLASNAEIRARSSFDPRDRWRMKSEKEGHDVNGVLPLFSDSAQPSFDGEFVSLVHIDLGDGAWVDLQQHWLRGHDAVFRSLCAETCWQEHVRRMYERDVLVPRLTGVPPATGTHASLLGCMAECLSQRYARPLSETSLALYRDGRDSVAPHGDKLGDAIDDAIVAIVSLGAPRRFTLQPAGRQGPPVSRMTHTAASGQRGTDPRSSPGARFWTSNGGLQFALGEGDLLVMGGNCQRSWLHGVPKVARAAPRMAVMFR